MNLNFSAKLIRKSINDKWELLLIDKLKVINYVSSILCTHEDIEKNISVSFCEKDLKTREELGYLHAEILPKLVIAYKQIGYPIHNEYAAKNQLKKDFGYYETYEVFDRNTGEIIQETKQKSFAKTGKKEMAKIIDFAIMICLEAGVEVNPSRITKIY